MKPSRVLGESRRRIPELFLMLSVLAGLAWCVNYFSVYGRLPQPFVFDPNDTFMDWFNTAYWAHHRGAFDVWKTVYPPLSFVFLKLAGDPSCYVSDAFAARDCDVYGRIAILSCWAIGSAVATYAFWKADPRTALFRGVGFTFGLPWLFTLERGNLILVCFIFFAFAFGGIARSNWTRAIASAFLINFKPYLLVPVVATAINRRWRNLELAGFATLGLYLLTVALLGDGTLGQLIAGAAAFIKLTGNQVWESVFYSTSYAPFLGFDTYRFPTRDFLPSRTVDLIMTAIPIIINVSRLISIVTIIGSFLQPGIVNERRIALILLSTYLVGSSPGGYTATFIVFLVFLEPWRRPGPIIAIVAAYVSCIPYDNVLSTFIEISSPAWLSQRPVTEEIGISLGIFLRPGLMCFMLWGIALDSLAQIIAAHRFQRPTIDPHPRVLQS